MIKDLVQLLRALSQSPYPSVQQTCMAQAADEIEGLRREILRCDDACFERDKEIARLRNALRGVTNASNCPYEVATAALSVTNGDRKGET